MKKVIVALLGILPMFLILFNQVQSVNISDFTPTIDKKIANMNTIEEKIEYLQSFSDLLNSSKYTKNRNAQLYKEIRDYCLKMLNVFEHELQTEQLKNQTTNNTTSQNFSKSTKDLPHLNDNFSNIDERSVRKAILSRHNEERKNV